MAFVRVKDTSTKHEFDVPEADPRIGNGFELVKSDRYPAVDRPRPIKYHVASKGAASTKPSGAAKKEVADNG